jgi:hypothetical protein
MFTQTRAATAAASRTAAPPLSVCRNARSGVRKLRVHAVRPASGGSGRDAMPYPAAVLVTGPLVPNAGQGE